MSTPRMTTALLHVLLAGAVASAAAARPDPDIEPHPGMLRYPDVSKTHIVFSYATDLWLVPRDGGTAVPLASPPGQEAFPRFSPDGQTVAFVGNYDGNRDLYTIPVAGGAAFRVTHHPSGEVLCDWTPDGQLLFYMSGLAGLRRQTQLFTVSSSGGLPALVPVPYGANGAVSPDGQWLAYTPHSTDTRTWKRYRGGMATDIWLFNLADRSSKRITDWEGTDTLPMWHGSTVYYLSDAGPDHRLNIWAYDTTTGKRTQITEFKDLDCRWPSIGPGPRDGGEIVFQNGAHLYLLDIPTRVVREVTVTIPGDRPLIRDRAVDASEFITAWTISPSAKRAAVSGRGDIWTLPAEHGTPRNLTRTSGVFERDPAWSPDGRWIAYFADTTGEYELYLIQSDGKGPTRQLTRDGTCFRYAPQWSPDSKHIVFTDKTGAIWLHTIGEDDAEGATVLVDRDPWANQRAVSWSHDSRWLAYAIQPAESMNSVIMLYDTTTGQKQPVTSDMFSSTSPTFDRKGDWLFFVSQRSFSPTYSDLDTTFIYMGTEVLLAVPLRDDVESPFLPKSDEEEWKDDAKAGKNGDHADEADKADDAADDNGDDGNGDEANGDKDDQDDDGQNADDPARADDGVSGTWTGAAQGPTLPPGGIPFTLELTLGENNEVTGSLSSAVHSGPIAGGTYDPDTRSVTFTFTMPGGIATFNLTIDGDSMTGTVDLEQESATITATRTARDTDDEDDDEEDNDKADKPAKAVEIDLDGFEARAIQLPVPPGNFGNLAVNDKGHLLYVRHAPRGSNQPAAIKIFDMEDDKREEKTVASGASAFDITPDGKRILVIRGRSASIQNAAAGGDAKSVVTAGMTAMINPREEWRQIFNDAWRIERDFFYVENMHGVDWAAMREHYGAMVDDCASRQDLSYVISEMISELNVGHAYYGGGDTRPEPSVTVGLLGCDFELASTPEGMAYRIARIYRGAPWDTDARGPLSQPGLDVKEGDFLLAVNGAPVDTAKDPWAAFIGLAAKDIVLTVSDKPVLDDDARDVVVRAIGSEDELRYRAWIERNRKYVDEMTSGRVGYIYVPNTGIDGQNDLVRQYFGQLTKNALIIDERWNGGGQIPTRFIEMLNRPITNYWARRDGIDWPWPPDAHQGPKCMLINGLAGSGGDMFPWLFRHNKLGKLIGTRTWGGLVGISGNPGLVDGGRVTAPTFGFYEADGTWGVEGHGVDPDIEVIDDPALMQDGADPQLDAAIQLMLTEIERNGHKRPKRPAAPDRRGMGIPDEDK